MNFELSEEHLMIQQAAKDFAETELLPGVIERDNEQRFPAEQIKKLGELGMMGMMVDPKWGGSGMDTVSYVLAMEEISKIDASASVVMSVNNSLVCWGLEKHGTEEQKEGKVQEFVGHQECRIDGVLVDVKRASASYFKKFSHGTLREEDPFGYIAQISAYADAHG